MTSDSYRNKFSKSNIEQGFADLQNISGLGKSFYKEKLIEDSKNILKNK